MGPGGQCQFRQAAEQRLKGNEHFEPGQWRADAEVNDGAETDMGVGIARRNKLIRVRKTLGIAVGGTQHQAHFFALLSSIPAYSIFSSA